MQNYSIERPVSQPIEGHAASFVELKLGDHQSPTKLFTFVVKVGIGPKIRACVCFIIEFFSDDHPLPGCTLLGLTTKLRTHSSKRRLSRFSSLQR